MERGVRSLEPKPEQTRIYRSRLIIGGPVQGELVIVEPIAFWGGFDPQSGEVTETRHPQRGLVLSGKIVATENLRGPSSSGSPLAESLRLKTAPRALLLVKENLIAVIAGIVGIRLYETEFTLGIIDPDALVAIKSWGGVAIDEKGDLRALS